MRLGLLTDIHEHVEHLRTALDCFQNERVDQIVVIGDLFQLGERIEVTCRLLEDAGVVGVWGNHDYGVCVNPDDAVRAKYGDDAIRYLTSLLPRLEIADCHFAHVEPWLDPEDIVDLWYYEGPPDDDEKLERIFGAVPNRLMFAGHYHKWLLATPTRIEKWKGDKPIFLSDERYFVVIGALCEGRCAVLDTESSELIPFNLQAR